jgi:membrane protease YdiL (CAAX protease family)
MNEQDKKDKIKQIDIENVIWLIYIGIIFLSWYSNYYEKKYYLTNDLESKKIYKDILTFVFFVLLIVYVYFTESSYKDLKKLKPTDTKEKQKFTTLSFIASSLVLISGIIFLYISIEDKNLDVELAFN